MRRLALSVLAVLLVLVTLWLSTRNRKGDALPQNEAPPVQRDEIAQEFVPGDPIAVDPADARQPSLIGSAPVPPPHESGAGASIRCRVLDPEGDPLKIAVTLTRLELVDRPDGHPASKGMQVSSKVIRFLDAGRAVAVADATGTVTFSDLVFGDYVVAVQASDGFLASHQRVELVTPAREVVLRCRRAVSARVEIVDPHGTPVPNARVSLLRAIPDQSTQTDERGVALLTGLDPDGDVGLQVRPHSAFDLFERRLDQWPVRDSRIVLERALTVSGRVVDEQGHPVPGANVHRKVGAKSWNVRRAGPDGRFRFRGLRAGEIVTFRLGPPGAYAICFQAR